MSDGAVATHRPRLRAVPQPPVIPGQGGGPVLRGRDADLEVIGDCLRASAGGHGGVLLVEGPPGIGKSSLLAEAQAIAGRLGVRALAGQAVESQQTVPFAALLSATLNSRPPIAPRQLAHVLRGQSELRYWMLHDLQGALEAAALERPLALILDDLHWADPGTVAALSTLPRQLSMTPVVWILARRTGEGPPPLRHALLRLQRAGARRLRVGALSDDAVAAVIADILSAPRADAELTALAASARGNPFLLVELLEGLVEEGRLRNEHGCVCLVGEGPPRRLAESMRDRLDRISDAARQVVLMASVLGSPFTVRSLASMLQRQPSALVDALQDAVAADLFVEAGDELAFRHDLLRQAVLDTLPRSLRRALQREAAAMLLEAGAGSIEVAARLADSAELGDRDAVARLRDAARALSGSDAAAAAELSVRALELLPAADDERGPLVAETVVLLHSAARPGEAQALGDEVLAGVIAPGHEAQVRLSLSSMTMHGPLTRAQENRRALELPGLTPVMRARHLGWLAFNLSTVAPGESLAVAVSALDAARESGDRQATVMARLARICVDAVGGRSAAALERLDALRPLTRGAPREPYLLIAGFLTATVLADLGRVDESLGIVEDAVAVAQRERNPWMLETWAQTGSGLRLAAGRLDDARAEAESCDAVEQAAGGSVPGAMALVALTQVAVHTGDAELLRACEAAARRVYDAGSADVRRHAAWILALVAMARRDPRDAARWLADDELPYCASCAPRDPGQEPVVARIAVAAGDRELGRRAVAVAETRRRENPGVPMIAATARQTRGLVDDDAGELLAAARMLRDTQRPLLHAAAAEDAGQALARAGRTEDAVDALTEALDRYAGCEAVADARRVRRLLRAHGVRARGPSPQRPTTGWASLTESELRVVRLVAQGATNRDAAEQLFLSPHTVSSHLRHAFAKLDLNSRNALTRVALAHDR